MQNFPFVTTARKTIFAIGLALFPLAAMASPEGPATPPGLEVANATGGVIFAVVVSPSENDYWGENLLDIAVIEPQDVVRVTVDDSDISRAGLYDILVGIDDPEEGIMFMELFEADLDDLNGLLVDFDGLSLRGFVGEEDPGEELLPSSWRGKGELI